MNTIDITSPDAFADALAAHPLLLVDFYKDDCPGCKMLDLSIGKFAASPAAEGVTLAKVKLEVVGESFFFSHRLRQTPTLLLFKQGEEVARSPGFVAPAKIEELVQGPALSD
ncbi:thioredoxin family protein [Halotalea alkalilenta]|uniref:Thiol reductase thioredoxin n=1 Tax=Halotalea alkalilenta TaxID=376489 RepID=A0A172YA88_9GAMM|nr:thioredoxin family protein [Halotalea alkalilenta]ANF56139.1 thiol reductase thioredoxin [Halotalea alkalilenta]